jgi:hypothetical protein
VAELRDSLRNWVRPGTAVLALACVCATFAGAAAAAPVAGSVSGPVISVKGSTFTLTTTLSPTGKSTVSVSKTTVITTQETLARSALATGACVMATGQKNAKGVVAATRITLSAPVKGQCTAGFGRGSRPRGAGTGPPGGGTRPPGTGSGRPGGGFGNFANFGFATGKVSALKGSTLTVKGKLGSKSVTTTVTVSAKTQIEKTVRVGVSAISAKSCAFVRGTSGDKGVKVDAQDISLSKATSSGCRFGFRGP